MSADLQEAGWERREIEGFTNTVGPFWVRRDERGQVAGLVAEQRHINRGGVVHGGVLSTMADNTMGWVVMEATQFAPIVTIQLNLHFVSVARMGDLIEGRGEIVRATRSMYFMRGVMSVRGETIATSEGIWKLLAKRPGG